MIKVESIEKVYKKKIVLDQVSLEIKKGEICALLGPNGAGKSTLMKIISGITKASSGNCTVNSPIGYMIEQPAFYDGLTGKDNLIALSKLFDNVTENDVDILLNMVGLSFQKDKKYKNYSYGMKQRLYFAYSLMNHPKILILDEPFNGVDLRTLVAFKSIITEFAKAGGCVLISSHNVSDLSTICNAVYILDHGKIVYNEKNINNINLEGIYLKVIREDMDAQ